MTSIQRALFWKECQEQKWKCALLTGILVSIQCVGIAFGPDWAIDVFNLLLTYTTVPFVIFIAMNVAAGERTSGTRPFIRALPAHHSQLARMKLFMGAVTCALPILVITILLATSEYLHGEIGTGVDPMLRGVFVGLMTRLHMGSSLTIVWTWYWRRSTI